MKGALQSHIEAVHGSTTKLKQSYEESYGQEYDPSTLQDIEQERQDLVAELRSMKKGKEKKQKGARAGQLQEQLQFAELISRAEGLTAENYPETLDFTDDLARKKKRAPFYDHAAWIRDTLDQPEYRSARRITVYEVDDPENLLRMGERPVPHCQNWRNNSSYNESLLSFVADANKKVIHIANGDGKPISMTTLRLIGKYEYGYKQDEDEEQEPVLLAENVYAQEWSDDYAVAIVGTLADKAVSICESTHKPVHIMTNNARIIKGMELFSAKYKVEIHTGNITFTMPPSRNPVEYVDCIGRYGRRFDPEEQVDLGEMHYLTFEP